MPRMPRMATRKQYNARGRAMIENSFPELINQTYNAIAAGVEMFLFLAACAMLYLFIKPRGSYGRLV